MSNDPNDPASAVYALVRTIPIGRVVTYGQVAGMVTDVSVTARQVGQFMNSSPPDVPWQRVVGAGGRLPIGKRGPHLEMRQRRLLEQEGVSFLSDDRVDLGRCQWQGEELGGLFDEAG